MPTPRNKPPLRQRTRIVYYDEATTKERLAREQEQAGFPTLSSYLCARERMIRKAKLRLARNDGGK